MLYNLFIIFYDKNIIINKVKSANQVSGSKQLIFFLDEIQLPIGELELAAINARNKYAHGQSNISEDELDTAIKYKNTYFTLYNRVMLKLLGFTGGYIDQATIGYPIRNINVPAGG